MRTRQTRAVLGLATGIILALLALAAPRAEAMCCVCRGGGCGTGGFCVDSLASSTACSQLCTDSNCPTVIFDNSDTCGSAGGCGVAGDAPTATPSASPTQTGTPTETPSHTPTTTFTATASSTPTATNTATITPTATVTNTPSITPTVTRTPTPLECCQQTGPACGPVSAPMTCVVGTYKGPGYMCDGASGNCFVPTATFTPTQTRTVTSTSTLTPTPTDTPTRTPTATPTDTPEVPMSIDPYKCYRIKTTSGHPKPDKRTITVVDQFGSEMNAVLRPFLECNPAQRFKGTGVTPAPLLHPEAHLVCYKIKTEKDPGNQDLKLPRKVIIRNKVEPNVQAIEYYDVMKSDLVCLPSTKELK